MHGEGRGEGVEEGRGFIPASKFGGPKQGFEFKTGAEGTGYYAVTLVESVKPQVKAGELKPSGASEPAAEAVVAKPPKPSKSTPAAGTKTFETAEVEWVMPPAGSKAEADALFARGEVGEACAAYSTLLLQEGCDFPSLLANRAACHLACSDFGACIDDCSEALKWEGLPPRLQLKLLLRR